MSSTTLRVTADLRDRVNRLGRRTHKSANDLLSDALDRYEEALFWEEYARAAAEPDASESAEAALWERATLADLADE